MEESQLRVKKLRMISTKLRSTRRRLLIK